MIKTTPLISVIICTYTEQRWEDLLAAVQSIQQQSLPAYELIVVVDHNAALFARAQATLADVQVIENTEPRGLSGARNSGVAAARGDLVAFLDDDAVAHPRWLELTGQCCQDSQVLGAGGIVEPLWPDQAPAWFPQEFYWVLGCSYQDWHGQVSRVRSAFGGNTCMRREVFETVGGFRTNLGRSEGKGLPLGCEEIELCLRARQHWPDKFFLCDPNAISGHRIPLQRINGRYFRSRCYAEGLSKAAIRRYIGTNDALATEQAYTRQILPRGFMRGLRDGMRGDLAGFIRAWMIIVGFTTTVAGYLVGRVSHVFRSRIAEPRLETIAKRLS